MAGEWIAIDLALQDKPEFHEIVELTGLDEPHVLWWLRKMWGWASMHCADGTARMTISRMVRAWGADEDFWRAVAAVGWLELDETAATVSIPGWDRRFSQAAKSRLQHRDRAAAQNEREPDRRQRQKAACAQAQSPPAPTRSRGEEIRGEYPPPPPREASLGEAAAALRAAWAAAASAGHVQPYKAKQLPRAFDARAAEDGWLDDAMRAIGHLPRCKFFETPVTLIQFCGDGFVARVLAGQYDAKKPVRGPGGPPADPPRRKLPDDFTAAVRATQAALDAKRREAS